MKYYRNGRECILCLGRKRLILLTPEERVRQEFISILIWKYKVPLEMIYVEEQMYYFQGTGRADIVVYEYLTNTHEICPLILVECKAPQIELNDTALSQAKSYNDKLNAKLIILTNGIETKIFETKMKNQEHEIESMPTYSELIKNKNFKLKIDNKIWLRPDHLINNKLESSSLIDEGIVGEDTNEKHYSFLINLYGLLYDPKTQLLDLNSNGFRFVKDIGFNTVTFGNAAGGSWTGTYRRFILEDDKGEHQIISVGLRGKLSGRNHPVYGNSTGYTMLLIAIDNDERSHLSLQLALDRFISIEGNKYSIFHDGTLTAGNKGRVSSQEVIDFIKAKKPTLIRNNKVFLGTLDNSLKLTFNNEGVKEFVQNLIDYAILRDQFRSVRQNLLA